MNAFSSYGERYKLFEIKKRTFDEEFNLENYGLSLVKKDNKDGENFMNNTVHNEEINYEKIKKHAPKIIEGINRLKDWSNN